MIGRNKRRLGERGEDRVRIFDYRRLVDRTWDNEIVSLVGKIHEYKGRQALYFRQKPVELERLTEIARIQSTEASNWIEGIVTTNVRLKQLVANKTTPRNRDEEEILGYRNVLNLIHENYSVIPIKPDYLLQLHRDLLRYTALPYGGKFKTVPNEIDMVLPSGERKLLFQPLEPYETSGAVEAICRSYGETVAMHMVDELILIPVFLLDFLCIHPFNDGNGRMSRILTLLLLYQAGYMVGQFISIEKAIADTKESYYEALSLADRNWHAGKNDPKPFIRYMLGIILSCYRDFEARLQLEHAAGIRSTAYDVVKAYALRTLGMFNKQDVLIACPQIGSSSAEAALKRLVEEKVVIRTGNGRKTRYVRGMVDR